jgi:hypothetical protein
LARTWGELAESRNLTAGVAQALAELDSVAGEAGAVNWDGYGAAPVSPFAYRQARRLLQLLPSIVPQPDIGITPQGHVALEWHAGPQIAFSIVVGPDRAATYAGMYGAGRVHGREVFADEVPPALVAALYRYLSVGGTT